MRSLAVEWGQSFSFEDKRVLEAACTIVRTGPTLLSCTLKNGSDGQFDVNAFYRN